MHHQTPPYSPGNFPRHHIAVAICIALAASCMLCGYEALRSASNVLFQAAYGTARLPMVMAVMPLGVFAALYLYGRLLNRFGPRRTLLLTGLGSAVLIAACVAAIRAGWQPATALLYIVREAYVILLIEQYWSYINSTLSDASARRLNGAITGVASIGPVVGGMALFYFTAHFGTVQMVLLAAIALIPAVILADCAYRIGGAPRHIPVAQAPHLTAAQTLGTPEFRLPRLRALLGVVIVSQVISTVLSLAFQGALQDAIPDVDAQTAWSGRFYALVNGSAAVVQFLVTPLILRMVSLRLVHALIPLVHVASCAALLAAPSLATAGIAYLLFKCLDYSIFRAAKELLYIPLSFDVRYRTKEVIDFFGYRTSKGAASLVITLAQSAGVAMTGLYAPVALVAATGWLGLVRPLTAAGDTKA